MDIGGVNMNITNKNNLPEALVEAARSNYKHKPNQYSASALNVGATETVLKRRYHDQIESDVSDLVWAIFGTAIHKLIENQEVGKKDLKEEHMVTEMGNAKISGIIDYYNNDNNTITDYKTSSVWKIIHKDYTDWKNQLFIYAYNAVNNGYKVDYVQNIVFLKDHSKTKAKVDKSYPQHPVQVIKFKFGKKEYDYIEKFILQKLKQIHKIEKVKTDKLPPCTKEERWYSGDIYALKKNGNKRAVKLYKSEKEAMKDHRYDPSTHHIEFRPGVNKKCEEYCDAKEFCPFYKKIMGKEDLPF